ncbi:tetratricopeptide repeat protein [Rickettsia endosymbiont of Gonocerus acuteangulatus]|uniref:tetratricopeptide repeat protein n=1 Tax=Rickettsia endosymbiont of Gonocerus acuteangulatus TaxID=3066266 RepID=UPI0031330AED
MDLLSTVFKTNSIKELEAITMQLPSVVKEGPYITFRIYNAVGESYNKLGDNEKAMESYNEALNIALNSRLISHAEEAQNFITVIYSNQGNLEKYKIEN